MGESRKPRGELAELSAQLQSLCMQGKRSDKELRAAKKEAFKKVINYMTIGMDMSGLFPMVTSCANLSPDDIVLKKMLYLYITHYASSTPDLALLAINQLHKDCLDQDPTVRSLALRSLCSLRIANLLEYVVAPVHQGLEDRHPLPRRTAVMGVLKIYHLNSDMVENTGLLDRLRLLLRNDSDAQVVGNCLTVLAEVEGWHTLAADKALVYTLINRLKEFSDWSQCHVLQLVSCYSPAGEPEVYDLLNALEDRLGHVNSAVVLAATKVFLHLTLDMTATHQQVLERLKDPLKSLIARDDPYIAYAVLAHARLLVQRAPVIFEQDHVAFYCRTHDPWYIKKLKMEILTLLASSNNVYDIVNELTEYTRDLSPPVAREAVKAVGRIALAVPDVNGVVERLLVFLDSSSSHIMAETLVQLKDLLRRYPDLGQVFTIGDIRPQQVEEPEARAALVWILGHFGQHVADAPYLLEPLAEGFAAEPPAVRLALLTAAAKLFFARPPEAQKLLGCVLSAGLGDSHQDVHDRALLYYRLLKSAGVEAAKGVILGPQPAEPLHSFSEDLAPEAQESIFQEFNTLSVVYQQPATLFVQRAKYHSAASEPNSPVKGGGGGEAAAAEEAAAANGHGLADQSTGLLAEADLLGDLGGGDELAAPSTSAVAAVAAPAPVGGGGSLLDFDLGDLGGVPAAAAPQQQQQQPPQGFSLQPGFKLMPGVFQERWRALAPVHQGSEVLNMASVAALAANNHQDFCAHMGQAALHTMASGGQPPMYKYYFYAASAPSPGLPQQHLFLVEMVVATGPRTAMVTVKSDAASGSPALASFLEVWGNCLAGFYR